MVTKCAHSRKYTARRKRTALTNLQQVISSTVSTELKCCCKYSKDYLLIIKERYTDTFIRDPSVRVTMCAGNYDSISDNGTQNVCKGVHSARFEVLSVALLKT